MQKTLLQASVLLLTATSSFAQDASFQANASRIVINTISGPIRNATVYVPNPVYPHAALQQHLSGRGLYKMDLDSGTPYDVRVVRSTGYKILDDAAVETLRTWRFLPHRLNWVTIPIEFGIPTPHSPENNVYRGKHRELVIFAPKPDYPLEARTKHLGGSGVIMLDANVETGQVTAARMSKSTGHAILDEAALTAFRRWRFKPGKVAPHVKIPITYTVSGAAY